MATVYAQIGKNASVFATIDADWLVRLQEAYDAEVQAWVDDAAKGEINGPNAWDGYLAAITADALVKAQQTGAIEKINAAVEKPDFYNK